MPIRAATPYLFFCGDASQAIELYTSALGAKVTNVQRFGDMPSGEGGGHTSPDDRDRILHAHLTIGSVPLMISDSPKSMDVSAEQRRQTNVQVALDIDDEAEATRVYAALSQGGQATVPIGPAFWGGKFGMLVDRFGIHWMFNVAKPTP